MKLAYKIQYIQKGKAKKYSVLFCKIWYCKCKGDPIISCQTKDDESM